MTKAMPNFIKVIMDIITSYKVINTGQFNCWISIENSTFGGSRVAYT